MKRRQVISLLGFLSLGGAAILWRNLASFWRPDASQRVARTLVAVADLIIPGDGLPSASQLGLHERVLAVPDIIPVAAETVAALEKQAVAQGASGFLALGEAGRFAALEAAFTSGEGNVQKFLLSLRSHLMAAYYAEPVVKQAFAYSGPPQPNGFADFQDPPT